MEITLEKIELVKDRTGVTYAEAKQALEETDGSVVDAIIAIEEIINSGEKGKGFGKKGEALFSRLKEIVKKGNVSKIQVKKDGELVLNVPVNAGLVGVVIAPIAAVVAVVAAFGFKCSIEIIKRLQRLQRSLSKKVASPVKTKMRQKRKLLVKRQKMQQKVRTRQQKNRKKRLRKNNQI